MVKEALLIDNVSVIDSYQNKPMAEKDWSEIHRIEWLHENSLKCRQGRIGFLTNEFHYTYQPP